MKKKSTKWIASWSGGKDSTASIILAHENHEPLDVILFSEVMFNETISGELPEHMDFVKNKAIPVFESWGIEVKILHHDKTYMEYFNQVRKRGKNIGKCVGFPMADKCNVRNCKVKPIEDFIRQSGDDCIQYIGLAADEPKRLERMDQSRKQSLLVKYGYTEQMAREKCKEYGLLSPYYEYSSRGGCWFCPNARKCQQKHVRDNHPMLWNELLALESRDNLIGNVWNTQANKSIHQMEESFKWEDAQMSIFDYIKER